MGHIAMSSFKLFMFLFSFGQISADFNAKNPDNYGPYKVEWDHYDQCHGPKMNNLTECTTSLTKLENGDFIAGLNITFLEATKVEEMKMNVYSMKDSSKVLLLNYIINKPCQHFAMAAVFEMILGVKNCAAKKGTLIRDVNLTDIMKTYMGNSFFYGEYIFKVVVTSKKGNIICLVFDPKFKKLKT